MTEKKNRKKRSKRRLLKKLAIGFACFLVVAATVLWFARGWLTERALEIVDKKLDEAGVHVSYEDPSLTPVRGLVLSNVTLFEDKEKTRPVLRLDDLAASISIRKLVRERQLGGAVTSKDGDAAFWHEGARRDIRDLEATIHVSAKALTIEDASCDFSGLRLLASGTIPLPEKTEKKEGGPDKAPKKEAESLEIDLSPLANTYDALETVSDGPIPEIEVEIGPCESETFPLEFAFAASGERFTIAGTRIDSVDLKGEFPVEGSRVEISGLKAALAGSAIDTAGSFDIDSGVVRLSRLASTADVARLAAAFSPDAHEALRNLTLTAPLGISGSDLVIPAKAIADASGSLSIDSPGTAQFLLGQETIEIGPFRSKIAVADGILSIDRTEIPVLGGDIRISGRTPISTMAAESDTAVQLDARKLTYSGTIIDALNVQGAYDAKAGTFTFTSLSGETATSSVRGSGSFHVETGVLALDRIAGSVSPASLLAAFAPDAAGAFEVISIPKPLALKGERLHIHTRDFARSAMRLHVDSPGPVEITASKGENAKPIAIAPFSTTVAVGEGYLQIPETPLSAMGGNFRAAFRTPLASPSPRFDLSLKGSAVSLRSIGEVTGFEGELAGLLAFDLVGTSGTEVPSINASAVVQLTEGQLYTVPFVGTFRNFLKTLNPRLKDDVASDLTAKLAMKDGVLHVSDLVVLSSQTEVRGQGDFDVVKDYIVMDVRANFRGLVGAATAVVSKVLEIRGEGPRADMKWGLKNVPKVAGQAVKIGLETGEAAVKTGAGVIKTGTEVIDKATNLRPGIIFKKDR